MKTSYEVEIKQEDRTSWFCKMKQPTEEINCEAMKWGSQQVKERKKNWRDGRIFERHWAMWQD